MQVYGAPLISILYAIRCYSWLWAVFEDGSGFHDERDSAGLAQLIDVGERVDFHGDDVGGLAGGDGAETRPAPAESFGGVDGSGAENLRGRKSGGGEQTEFLVTAFGAEDAEIGSENDVNACAIGLPCTDGGVLEAIVDELGSEESGRVGGSVLDHEGDGFVIERAMLDGVGTGFDDGVEKIGRADDVDGDSAVELMGGVDDGFDFVEGFDHFDVGVVDWQAGLAKLDDVCAAADFFADDLGAFDDAGAIAAIGDVFFEVAANVPIGWIEVPAGDGDLSFGDKHARAGHGSVVYGVAERVGGEGGITEISDGSEAVHEESFEAREGVEHGFGGSPDECVADLMRGRLVEVENAADVCVHVDQARHDPGVFEVDDLVAGMSGGDEAVFDGDDFAVFDEDRLVGGFGFAGFRDEVTGVNYGGVRECCGRQSCRGENEN